jgi:ribose transport system permease protein
MKRTKWLGIAALILAVLVMTVGLFAEFGKRGDGFFADALSRARENQAALDAAAKAVKNAAAVEKRGATADSAITAARTGMDEALSNLALLDGALIGNATGDAELDRIRDAAVKVMDGVDLARSSGACFVDLMLKALTEIEEGGNEILAVSDARVLALYQAIVADGYKAVSAAETAVIGVRENALKVFELAGDTTEIEEIALTEEPTPMTVDECRAALSALDARADALEAYREQVGAWAAGADSAANAAASAKLSFGDRLAVILADAFIGVLFTAVLLLLLGLVLLFLAEPFKRQWAKTPTFSVGIALIAMLVFQTYALGFSQGSVGAWAKFWFDNTFNVLRANTSVGMIALGMTLVIITGGIDLAVGSTLAGVGTVLMTMIDTGEHGVLVKFGIMGYPAFAIGILVALAFGTLIGGLIGLLVTKGRIPPFIVTLGVMNIIRSVAQYFTKSYSPTVPKSFEAIANTTVFGQRPMTIVYWLVLAVIFYLIMKHTAFGRYVYAVGSNERTTRLSGINTDRVKRRVYMLTGLVVAIAAVSQLSRLGGMDVASAGSGYELDAIAAVVVGGTAMSGGRGSIVGTVLGVLIIGIMNNLLILLGVDSFLTDAFKGAIVVVAVLMQRKEKLA